MLRNVMLAGVCGALAALAAGAAQAAPNISGFWELQAPAKAPVPSLTAKAKAAIAKFKVETYDTDRESNLWCVSQGMPHVMDSAGPIDIIQGSQEYTLLAEHLATARHIYVAGQKHQDPNVFDFTMMGNSIAHWQGDVLVVDTIGFNNGVGPFGAPRTEKTHLVERFAPKGDAMAITYTWTDPATYTKPFTYTLHYKRLPKEYRATDFYCDPRKNGKFLEGEAR